VRLVESEDERKKVTGFYTMGRGDSRAAERCCLLLDACCATAGGNWQRAQHRASLLELPTEIATSCLHLPMLSYPWARHMLLYSGGPALSARRCLASASCGGSASASTLARRARCGCWEAAC